MSHDTPDSARIDTSTQEENILQSIAGKSTDNTNRVDKIRLMRESFFAMQTSTTDASAMVLDEDQEESMARDEENLQNATEWTETDTNPFSSSKKSTLRRQSAVEVPQTSLGEVRSPVEVPQTSLGEVRSPVSDRNAECYNMAFPKRGIAVIFNHMEFHYEKYREGSEIDCELLEKILSGLGFETRVHLDLKYKQLRAELQQLSNEDHSDHDCLLIAVLTHGDRGELHAKDEKYKIDRLWENFAADRCPSLAGKPKIFVIQACRGDKVDAGMLMTDSRVSLEDTVDSPSGRNYFTIPNLADIIIANSTADGYVAFKNKEEGSWYIQTLCEELEKHCESRDLATILTFVSRRVAVERESNVRRNPKLHAKKQIPCVVSMLTRLVYLQRKLPAPIQPRVTSL